MPAVKTSKKPMLLVVFAALVASGVIVVNSTHYLCPGDGKVYTLEGGVNATKPWLGYPAMSKKSTVTCKDKDKIKTAFVNCLESGLCLQPKQRDCGGRFAVSHAEPEGWCT